MKMWSKKTNTSAISAACAAGQELSREKLLRKTLYELAIDGSTDRVGVWLDAPDTEGMETSIGPGTEPFRGIVWDRQSQNIPLEWQRLSAESPLAIYKNSPAIRRLHLPSFPWKNGDAVWINALGSNPCAAIWSSAIETRRLSSTEGSAATSRSDEVARIVAIPLEVQKN